MRFTKPLSGLALLAALALASCGGGSGSSTSSTQPAGTAATPAQFPKASTAMFLRFARSIPQNGPVLAATGEDFTPGTQRFGFGLFEPSNKLINGAQVALYVQPQKKNAKVLGPFVAHEETLAVAKPYLSETVAKDPDSAKAFYVTDVKFPSAGKYNVLAVLRQDDRLVPTGAGVLVRSHDPIPAVGEKPPLINTPTVKSVNGNVASIDTRTPHDDMHDVNFRDVVGKKPAVLLFATPLLCQSRVCGPVTDIAEEVKHTMPAAKQAAFIHMEVYNQNNANKGYRPQLKAFHLQTEPWLFVVDKSGRISTRIEGAFGKDELEGAIQNALKQ